MNLYVSGNHKTHAELDEVAVEIVNLIAEKEIILADVDYILKSVEVIISEETKIKRID